MTIMAEKYDYVIGIDTHARTHTYAIINTGTGARIGCEAFPVSGPGMGRAIAWIRRNTSNEIIVAVEAAGLMERRSAVSSLALASPSLRSSRHANKPVPGWERLTKSMQLPQR